MAKRRRRPFFISVGVLRGTSLTTRFKIQVVSHRSLLYVNETSSPKLRECRVICFVYQLMIGENSLRLCFENFRHEQDFISRDLLAS